MAVLAFPLLGTSMSLKLGGDVAVLAFSLLGTSMSLKIGGDVAVLAFSHILYECSLYEQ